MGKAIITQNYWEVWHSVSQWCWAMGTMGRPMPRNSSGVRHSWREGEEKKGKERTDNERKGIIKEGRGSKREEPVQKRARVLRKLQGREHFQLQCFFHKKTSYMAVLWSVWALAWLVKPQTLCPFPKSHPLLIFWRSGFTEDCTCEIDENVFALGPHPTLGKPPQTPAPDKSSFPGSRSSMSSSFFWPSHRG